MDDVAGKLDIDPDQIEEILEQQTRKPKRKGWLRVCTIVPREWESRLLEAKRVSTYRLAIELLYQHWRGKGGPVTVSSTVAQAVKISATSKWTALAELERLGLIELDRKPRRAPRAILRHTQRANLVRDRE